MTPYVSRYRRIWVIAYSLVRAWSCVEGSQEIHLLALPLGAAPAAVLLSAQRGLWYENLLSALP